MAQKTDITEKLRKLLRYDIGYADFIRDIDPRALQDSAEQYAYTLDDMIALVGNLIGKSADRETLKKWLGLVFNELEIGRAHV